ncbi:MAG: CRISPR-associated endonuclease Cas2 [Clostridiales bacterium]|nr:CRISPR-associated endonuclease Cas2 [Clostridiales bacterium]
MRMIVFFDLPTETSVDRRNYRLFRKTLVKNGFIMLQESVYCKLMTNPSVEDSVKNLLKSNKPPKGIVLLLTLTEKQFARMEYLVGEHKSETIDTTERLVIL